MSFQSDDTDNVIVVSEEMDFAVIRDFLMEQRALSMSDDNSISLNFGWRQLSYEQVQELIGVCDELGIYIDGIISCSGETRNIAESFGIRTIIGRLGISGHYSRFLNNSEVNKAETAKKELPLPYSKDPSCVEETIMLRRNLRTGESLEARGNVVIQGNIEYGSEVLSAGDIIVLGTIKGEAHAGFKGNSSAQIICFVMDAASISIAGMGLSAEEIKPLKKGYVTRVSLKDSIIVLEPYKV